MVADKQTNIHTYKQQNKLHTEINKKHKKNIAYVRLNDKQLYHKSYHKYITIFIFVELRAFNYTPPSCFPANLSQDA